MYQFLDQPLARLDPGSRFVVSAMRIWVMAVSQRRCPPRVLLTLVKDEALHPSVCDLHRLMLTLHCNGLRPMQFGAPGRPVITEAEALMLSLWAAIVADEGDTARATLELLVREPAITPMMGWMVRAAAHLSTVGLAPAGRLHNLPAPKCVGPGDGATQ
jgi:hypothetical protein